MKYEAPFSYFHPQQLTEQLSWNFSYLIDMEDSSFLFGERGQRCVGEKPKRIEDFVYDVGQSLSLKQLEALGHFLGSHII